MTIQAISKNNSRYNIMCAEKHTPLCPQKNSVRRNWIETIDKSKDLITISHGAFDVLNILRYHGNIYPCDIVETTRKQINYLRRDYPDLKIKRANEDIRDLVKKYCQKEEIAQLGAVDIDLASTLENALPVFIDVMVILTKYDFVGKTILTFLNARDQFKGVDSRIAYLQANLFPCVTIEKVHKYYSGRVNENAGYKQGSNMCAVVMNHDISKYKFKFAPIDR